ncbi:MAG: SRPBCC family protein [Candidatus Limnocylindrales bacterium]
MIRTLIRLLLLGALGGWFADIWLRSRAGGGPPLPFASLVVIDAPIERVWTALADIEGQPRWMDEMKSVRLRTPPPVGVGTRGDATVRIFGLGTTDPVEITEFTPPRRFAIRHEGTFTGGGLITLEPGADGSTTIVRWDETLVAPFLPYLWAVAAAPVMTGIFQADLLRFRDLVESGG